VFHARRDTGEEKVSEMRRESCVLIAIVAALLAACSSTPAVPDSSAGSASAESSSSSDPGASMVSEVPSGQVRVTVTGLTGADGGTLAGAVFDGPTAKDGVGGFAVRVTSDPFATTQIVTEPQTLTEPAQVQDGLFPFVTSTPLVLEDGRYRLEFWAAPKGVTGYARWVAAETPGLLGCSLYFTVQRPMGTAVTIANVPSWPGQTQSCTLP
jgi:hypothetical protein